MAFRSVNSPQAQHNRRRPTVPDRASPPERPRIDTRQLSIGRPYSSACARSSPTPFIYVLDRDHLCVPYTRAGRPHTQLAAGLLPSPTKGHRMHPQIWRSRPDLPAAYDTTQVRAHTFIYVLDTDHIYVIDRHRTYTCPRHRTYVRQRRRPYVRHRHRLLHPLRTQAQKPHSQTTAVERYHPCRSIYIYVFIYIYIPSVHVLP